METAQTTDNQRERLNNVYRFQRHFYDATRRFFLIGRDELLEKMNVQSGERVLEVGCGTGRNLLNLARIQPAARIYGLDASDEMLKTAAAKIDARDLQKLVLQQCLAEEFSYQKTFGQNEPFDKIFISYSLSMFPQWREALENTLANLKPTGDLYILDFWDGALLPAWFNRIQRWWLGLFKAYARREFLDFLNELKAQGAGELNVSTVGRRYAYIASFKKK